MGELELDQKRHYLNFLTNLQRWTRAGVIAEEILDSTHSFGKRLAERLGLRYLDVAMSFEERTRRGIPLRYSDTDTTCTPEEIDNYHWERERYMVEQTLSARPDGDTRAILICAPFHSRRVGHLLAERGIEHQVTDLSDFWWHIDDWPGSY
jgi:hypothetical protein